MTATQPHISFLGFGEAGQAFAEGLTKDGLAHLGEAYDIKTLGPDAVQKRGSYARFNLRDAGAAEGLFDNADAVFSLVTAEAAEAAATDAARAKLNGALFFDCNSCAPETKKRSAAKIEAAGGRYVDVAIMTPVHPKLHQSPCLLAGPHAEAAEALMGQIGMNVTIAGANIGDASSRKMIRSVMIKGLEALTLECFLAARQAGLDEEVMASLDRSFPGFDWPSRAPYMIERAMTHGTRRAAEMREVVKTLTDLGVTPHITQGTVARQSEIGALGLDAKQIGEDDLKALTTAILNILSPK